MTWRVIIPPDLQQEVWGMSPATGDAVLNLVQRLRTDPDAATGPFGHEDTGPERVRQAAADNAIVVVIISDTTGNVTFQRVLDL
ncbi:hypothetical protein ACWGII_30730 [Streptomyces sp. NPDC054855]